MKLMNNLKVMAVAMLTATNINAQTLDDMPVMTGAYTPDWENLATWECPDWFRDAKFGIWAHWDPQCEAEDGDWYARSMYGQDSHQWNRFTQVMGTPPSKTMGYKDLCDHWKADKWNPAELIKLYYEAGARYFMTMGQHHDNFDCWDSPYQEWNSVAIGPKKDIVGGWIEECRKYGMKVGVSMHGAHAWTFFEIAWDYDVKMTKEDGLAKNGDGSWKYWWHGLDPQELYAQNHAHSSNWSDWGTIHNQWHWGNGVCPPSVPYMQKFQNRVLQCIEKYSPDMLYFDDTVLPFYGASTNPDDLYSLNILAHFYNHSAAKNGGQQQVVVTGKILNDMHKEAMLWDVERGIPGKCQDKPWQTCTCIGGWHYGDTNYKSAAQVIHMLVDIVSKNGNLLLSIPIRGNGTIDDQERRIVADITAWMKINSESIYGTRPWKVTGEGPLAKANAALSGQGFNEGDNYSSSDVCFVQKDGKVYATIMRWPNAGPYTLESFAFASPYYNGKVKNVKLLGYGNVDFTADLDGVTFNIPKTHPNEISPVFEFTFEDAEAATYESLLELIQMIEQKMGGFIETANYNTGKYSPYAVDKFQQQLAAAKNIGQDATPEQLTKAINAIREAYTNFRDNGKNKGGALTSTGTDITVSKLVEASNFSRSDGKTTRFGTPTNWTVENFNLPQNNSNGNKNGIDNYPGSNCLMLGVWSGEDRATSDDLANARIYRKVTLAAGRYFFGATYNAAYQLSDHAYIFASKALSTTDELPVKSIAYFPLNECVSGDGKYYGIEFTLDEEQEVILGWQVDLTRGSGTQEFRAERLKLVNRGNITKANLNTLLKNVNSALNKTEGKINDNTGFYNAAAVNQLQQYATLATNLPDDATQGQINDAYYQLQAAYEDFQANGLNPHGVLKLYTEADTPEGWSDITADKLGEKENFSRTDASTTRFGKPLYWTVENFQIPNGGDGTKNGLDSYSGQDALMLGVWNDRSSNQGGSSKLANARIYKQIHLETGRYFFGARYNANYSLSRAYMFVSPTLLTTNNIPTQALSYYSIADCGMDGLFYGLYFTVPEPQDVYIGFQANLATGSATQEFRADGVRLLSEDDFVANAIEPNTLMPKNLNEGKAMYDLQGRKVDGRTQQHGIYIIQENGTTKKVYR